MPSVGPSKDTIAGNFSANCSFVCLRRENRKKFLVFGYDSVPVRAAVLPPSCRRGSRVVLPWSQRTNHPIQYINFLLQGVFSCINKRFTQEVPDLGLWLRSEGQPPRLPCHAFERGKHRQRETQKPPLFVESTKIMCAQFMSNHPRVFSCWVPKGFTLCACFGTRPREVQTGFDKHKDGPPVSE